MSRTIIIIKIVYAQILILYNIQNKILLTLGRKMSLPKDACMAV